MFCTKGARCAKGYTKYGLLIAGLAGVIVGCCEVLAGWPSGLVWGVAEGGGEVRGCGWMWVVVGVVWVAVAVSEDLHRPTVAKPNYLIRFDARLCTAHE